LPGLADSPDFAGISFEPCRAERPGAGAKIFSIVLQTGKKLKMVLKRIPPFFQWMLAVVSGFLLLMQLARLIFYLKFSPPRGAFPWTAFVMGLRFDVKFACILGTAMLVLCSIPFLNPFRSRGAAKVWTGLLALVFMAAVVFYTADYFHYDYLRQRLNASVLNFINDAGISFHMARESYPIFTILLGIIIVSLLCGSFFHRLLLHYRRKADRGRQYFRWWLAIFLLFAAGVFGKLGQYNLRWSDAFGQGDNFKASLSLNPFQSFFSTLSFKDTRPDLALVRANYPLMARYLGVPEPDSNSLSLERYYPGGSPLSPPPNVVLVICESFSMYRSSMSGNPLNTTPFFNELCKNGVFYDRCFAPAYPTARGVWATVTSLPDVLGDNNRSASRNPEVVNQQLILNDLKGYEKYYFLGGDPTWANIKAMLLNNIDSLRLYSQDDFKAKKLNVWGIDDKNLFLEANKVLSKGEKPFFAIIQTADNHRPYTIPEADLGLFRKVSYPIDTVHKYGFDNIEQLNAFRYTDFCFQQFFEAAGKEAYYPNTIFIFVGDHGIGGNATAIYPASWTEQALTGEHIPLLFYAPALLSPRRVDSVCSQVDIMPSVAGLLKIPYRNNSLGRNLFDTTARSDRYAFIIHHDAKEIGLVGDSFYFVKNLKSGKTGFVSVRNNNPVPANPGNDSIRGTMARLTEAYYQISRYLLFNNKRKVPAK
jgi:phosphoglycerol transferase MdoB-like AlkP superfamily enzyme